MVSRFVYSLYDIDEDPPTPDELVQARQTDAPDLFRGTELTTLTGFLPGKS